ncbi:MAG: tRNA lysidine(34) synthetase TilS [Armatimonadota bacterium]|nr:tRNA lysidine(34) synthetase TilS [Armatimonadota bacterium]MDR7550108.1 tRNA lysidine(34) synthetase TilS [Armatimonadota bacterium]
MRTRARPVQILARVRATLRRYGMLSGGERVVVATSGGPDSMALLHLLGRLRDELNLHLHAVSVDHGLHHASGAHADFVRRTARAWGIPVSVVRVNVEAHARRARLTVEEAARALRYAALARVARRIGATHIAVAHTADDQVETVLLWLLRGAAPDGLAGMPAKRSHGPLQVIRPMIDLWRSDVLGYLAAEGVPYRTDPTNRRRRPLRNRIRQDLLPRLVGYNPGIKAVLRRLAEQTADDAALLEHLAGEAAAETLRRVDGRVAIDAARFRSLPVSLQRRVAYRALVEAGGNIRGLAFVHVERLREMAGLGRDGERADLPGVQAERTAREIVLVRARARAGRRMLQ